MESGTPTENRISTTDASCIDELHLTIKFSLAAGPQACEQVQFVPRWKAGIELPPFHLPWTTRAETPLPTGIERIQTQNILSTPSFEPIVVTRGVAMHLYFLIIYPSTRAAELMDSLTHSGG